MKERGLILMVMALVGCKPDVGSPVSLITGPSILAVRGEPPEASPERGEAVTYEVLAVDVDGRIPSLDGAVNRPALWAVCTTPKPPVEANAVNRACVDGEDLAGQYGFSLTGFSAPMPRDACSLFGPNSPPPKEGELPIRPRDPDVTNGFYLPVRVSLWIPEGQRRAGMAGEDTLVSFGLERISCGLPNVPGDFSRKYVETYTLNSNPRLAGLRITSPTEMEMRPGVAAHIPQNAKVIFEAAWREDSAESFPVWDVEAQELKTTRESMVVAWYATGGSFHHESTGRGENEAEITSSNDWTAGGPGEVHMWLVLRDNRGGTDFASYELVVDP